MANRYNIFLILNLFLLSLGSRGFRITEEIESENEISVKPPGFSRVSGFYKENFKLKLQSEENTTIYFTVDSTDPKTSPTAQEFKDYILIYDKSSETNDLSSLTEDEESPISISRDRRYRPPEYPVDKAMIVKAVSKNVNGEYSQVVTKVYFITDGYLYKYKNLTVISLVTNPENLIDPNFGIYVTGTMYQEWKKTDDFDRSIKPWDKRTRCNYYMRGSEWEREAFLTIFDKGEVCVQQNIGLRVKGRASRNYPQKSFNLNARKKYGKSTIETDILNKNYDINGKKITSYKSLAIRSVYDNSRMKDKIGRDLFESMNYLTTANMEPAVLFLNGEYWGFYCIQENFNDDFIEKNYLIPKQNVALAKGDEIEEGPEEEIQNFLSFCEEYSKKDLGDEKLYEEIKNYIDIESMIQFFVTGLYIEDTDWPGNNDGVWRNIGEKIEGNEFGDGRWRFIIFDLDLSMSQPFRRRDSSKSSIFDNVVKRIERSPINPLFLSLLNNNTDFQNKFVNTYCDYTNEIFKPSRVNKILDKYRKDYPELIANSQVRWNSRRFNSKLEGFSSSKSSFLNSLNSISNFFGNRANYTLQNMKDFIGLKGDIIDLTIEIIGKGKLQINTIIPNINGNKWTGKYISGIPIVIKGISVPGYKFIGWRGYIESNKQSEEIILFESQTIIAYFD